MGLWTTIKMTSSEVCEVCVNIHSVTPNLSYRYQYGLPKIAYKHFNKNHLLLQEEGLKWQHMLQLRSALLLVHLSVDTIMQHSLSSVVHNLDKLLKAVRFVLVLHVDWEKWLARSGKRRVTTWAKGTVLCVRSVCCLGELDVTSACVTSRIHLPWRQMSVSVGILQI